MANCLNLDTHSSLLNLSCFALQWDVLANGVQCIPDTIDRNIPPTGSQYVSTQSRGSVDGKSQKSVKMCDESFLE